MGQGTLDVLERIRRGCAPVTDRLLDKLAGPRVDPSAAAQAGMRSFEQEAEAIMSTAKTHRAQTLVRSAVVVTVVLLVWASVAPIDEVTKGEAKVIPSRQLQVIQSLDGGVVSEILVKEGQVVEAGQLLLKVDETRATSGVRESAAQAFSLRVKAARLKALAEGTGFSPPAAQDGNEEEARILDEERQLYDAKRSELMALVSISEQQLAQRRQELSEAQARRSSAARSLDLSQQELAKTRPLLSTGAVSEVEVLRLEREVSRARGDMEQAGAQSARAQAAIAEASRKIQETDLSFRNEARRELSDVLARLNALNEGAVALADKVDKSQVRSPVRGRVQRLLANTVGGVVSPGRDIVEIVPLDDALVLEAKIQPRDIAFIHPGQKATVKFTAYDFSIYGGMDAVVENISPDTVTDERGNNTYYVVRVRTTQPQIKEGMPIMPGMTAEVDVLTGKKTVMGYLLKPVLKAHDRALTER
ncbi:HlyD family type I secretion periplasmic adaptor subunit [Aquabacterium fontiphilum]|nr:HlyD family type I secretion periplasmic adaptor subunit [Aquabacterium fontiphilum]